MNGLKQGVKAAWDNSLSPLFEEFSADVEVEVLDPAAPAIDPLCLPSSLWLAFLLRIAHLERITPVASRGHPPVSAPGLSNTSRTFRLKEAGVNGFSMNSTPLSNTP